MLADPRTRCRVVRKGFAGLLRDGSWNYRTTNSIPSRNQQLKTDSLPAIRQGVIYI